MKIIRILPAVGLAFAVAACGGPSSPDRNAMAPPPPAPMAMMSEQAYESAPMEDVASGGSAVDAAVQQYIAYSHSLGLRLPVDTIEPVMQGHIAACNAAGTDKCIVTNSYLNAWSEDEASGSLNLRATPDWIETFLNGVEAEADAAKGEVTTRQTTAEDLTVTIIDTNARLHAQEALQKRIEDLLENRPGDLGELLDTERELARVNGEIDSLKSSMKALMQRVNMSQLAVSYETKRNPVSQECPEPARRCLRRVLLQPVERARRRHYGLCRGPALAGPARRVSVALAENDLATHPAQ